MSKEENLTHFGVKGMQWGIHRSSDAKASTANASDDSKRATAAKQKMKKSGAKTLSNQEMQDLVNRMNLEKQLSTLTTTNKTKYKNMVEKNLDQAMNKGMRTATDYAVKFAFQQIMNTQEQKKKQKQLALWAAK